jgi:FPC/CPF motif-containing protein YcgG
VTWAAAPAPLRTLARWLTIVQAVGYTVSLVFIWHTTGLTPAGAAARYRGSDSTAASADAAMQFPKSFAEMLTNTHTHLLSMAAIFAFSGLILAFCERPGDAAKRFLIAEPFAALLVSFSAMWLMRYAHPAFAWLLVLSSTSMAIVFYIQTGYNVRELFGRRGA